MKTKKKNLIIIAMISVLMLGFFVAGLFIYFQLSSDDGSITNENVESELSDSEYEEQEENTVSEDSETTDKRDETSDKQVEIDDSSYTDTSEDSEQTVNDDSLNELERQFSETRNAQRRADVNAILNAITQYYIDNLEYPFREDELMDCSVGVSNIGTGEGNLDLGREIIDKYLVKVPQDPLQGTDEYTGYTVCLTDGRVRIEAMYAELGERIYVER